MGFAKGSIILLNLSDFRKVHFIAIGGIGMSALARILIGRGMEVRGSDESSSHLTEDLARRGAVVFIGHKKEQIGDAELVVVSSAIKYENEELEEAKRLGLPIWHRSELLKALMSEKISIAVTGAHGKTTTSSMLTTLLILAQKEPAAILGGELSLIQGNSCWGKGEYLIAEVDESDGSFLNLQSPYVIVTNIEADHLDHYGDLNKIEDAFVAYLNRIPSHGVAVLGIDSPSVRKIIPRLTCKIRTFGVSADADLQAREVECYHGGSESKLYKDGVFLGLLRLMVPGEYNVMNALATVSMGLEIGLSFQEIQDGLLEFRSSKRRYELIGTLRGITIVEDYAHHPTEVKALLAAAKTESCKRVVIVFQPHLYSRTRNFKDEFGQAFSLADLVVMTDVFASREKRPEQGISGATLVEAIAHWDPNRHVVYIPNKHELVKELIPLLQIGDLILFVGAGDINQFGVALYKELSSQKDIN